MLERKPVLDAWDPWETQECLSRQLRTKLELSQTSQFLLEPMCFFYMSVVFNTLAVHDSQVFEVSIRPRKIAALQYLLISTSPLTPT